MRNVLAPSINSLFERPNLLFSNKMFWQTLVVLAMGGFLGVTVLGESIVGPDLYPLLIIAAMIPCAIMIFGEVKKLLLIVILLEIPIQVDQSFFYNDAAASFSAIGGFNVSITTFCIIGLYIIWLLEILARKTDIGTNFAKWPLRFGIGFLLFTIASMFYARDFTLALFGVNLEVQAFLLFIYLVFQLRTRADIELVVKVLIVTLLIQAVIMLIIAALGRSFYLGSIFFRIDYGTRVGGTAGGGNATAGVLILLLSLTFSTLLTQLEAHWKLIAMSTFGLGVLALLVTLSRGGWGGFAFAMVVFYFGAFRMRWVSLAFPFVSLVVVTGLAFVFGDLVAARIFGDDGGAAQGRVPLMYLAVYMIRDHIWFGVGVNNFSQAWAPYLTPEFYGIWLHTVHNKYMLVWSETGVGGITCFVGLLLSIIKMSSDIVRQNVKEFFSPMALGICAGIAGLMLHMNVEILTGRPQVQFFWVLCGLGVALYNVQHAEQLQGAVIK